MGGHLEVRSAPGKGTTMQVLLPLVILDQEDVPASAPETVAS
jgi:signal transduction histidine kinase